MLFEMLLLFISAAIVLTTLGLLFILIKEFNRQSRRKTSLQTVKRRPTKSTRKGSVSRNTQGQLVRLLQGDRQAAIRLVERERVRHPNQNEQWIWEKVTRDLERDRRC